MTMDLTSLWSNIRGLVFFGWAVAATRLLLDFVAPEQSMYVGVYYLMPVAYLYFGLRGKWDHLPWRQAALALVAVAFFVWFIPNFIAYSAAFLTGLEQGRFSPGNSGRLSGFEGPFMTILNGGWVAGITFLVGSAWSVVLGTLLIWLPGALRRRRR